MLITKELEIKLNSTSIKHYEELGYIIPRYIDKNGIVRFMAKNKLLVKATDLPKYSKVRVDTKCDGCGELSNTTWMNYFKTVKENGKCYCNKCAMKLYGTENMRKIKLLKGISFEQWCIEHDSQCITDLWDYSLNKCKPNDIGYAVCSKYYFKCPKGIHKSELKQISIITRGDTNKISCNYCHSFAQYLIDLYGEDALSQYWDYELNNINPWEIRKNTLKKVYIKCQDKEKHHESYLVQCNSFASMNSRCPRCVESKLEVKIGIILDNKNINYTAQKTFKSCSYKKLLRFDFYLNDFNICIETQGIQHYEPIDFAGRGSEWAEESFKGIQIKDNIKRDYCKENGIELLEIKYTDSDIIEQILSQQQNNNLTIQEAI